MGRNMPYTASRHLWNAASSVEFFRAWREQPQWTIQNFDFKEFWQYARAEDLDDFTRMMLTVYVHPPTPFLPLIFVAWGLGANNVG